MVTGVRRIDPEALRGDTVPGSDDALYGLLYGFLERVVTVAQLAESLPEANPISILAERLLARLKAEGSVRTDRAA